MIDSCRTVHWPKRPDTYTMLFSHNLCHFMAQSVIVESLKEPVTPNSDAMALAQRLEYLSACCGVAVKYALICLLQRWAHDALEDPTALPQQMTTALSLSMFEMIAMTLHTKRWNSRHTAWLMTGVTGLEM